MMAREYLWIPGKGYTEKGEGKSNAKSDSTERGIHSEATSANGPMAAEPGATGPRDAEGAAPEPGGANSPGKFPEHPGGQRGSEYSSEPGDGSDDRRADEGHAGAPPGVSDPIFDEDRAIHVDFDDLMDIARRTRVSSDGNKP